MSGSGLIVPMFQMRKHAALPRAKPAPLAQASRLQRWWGHLGATESLLGETLS